MGRSTWTAAGAGQGLTVAHTETWDPDEETVDALPAKAAFSPDRKGRTSIVYSRELETLTREGGSPRCAFLDGTEQLTTQDCTELQALLAAQLLSTCKGE